MPANEIMFNAPPTHWIVNANIKHQQHTLSTNNDKRACTHTDSHAHIQTHTHKPLGHDLRQKYTSNFKTPKRTYYTSISSGSSHQPPGLKVKPRVISHQKMSQPTMSIRQQLTCVIHYSTVCEYRIQQNEWYSRVCILNTANHRGEQTDLSVHQQSSSVDPVEKCPNNVEKCPYEHREMSILRREMSILTYDRFCWTKCWVTLLL